MRLTLVVITRAEPTWYTSSCGAGSHIHPMFYVPARHAVRKLGLGKQGLSRPPPSPLLPAHLPTKLRGSAFNHAPHGSGHPLTSPWLKTAPTCLTRIYL